MESSSKQSGRPRTRPATAKSSHIISKLDAVSSTRVIPTIRTVQILSPQIFETDPANFLALVQKLTGKKPAPKKPVSTIGSKKRESLGFKKSRVGAQSAAYHSHALAVVDEYSFTNQVSENDNRVLAPLAPIERDSLVEDGVQVCDSFSELFGGLENFDFLSTLIDSASTPSEFPMIYPPTVEQIDYGNSILETLNSGEFSHFYQ